MRKLIMAVFVVTAFLFATLSSASTAPVLPVTMPYATSDTAIQQNVLPVHWRGPRHNCRRHGACGGYHGGIYFGPGGVYIGPGYGHRPRRYRSCRRTRRWCRREWGGGRNYRRCVRRRGCRP
jgi:hypothetical protein